MTNPVSTRNKVFTERTPVDYPGMPGCQVDQSDAPSASTGRSHTAYPPPTHFQEASPGVQSEAAAVGICPVTLNDVLIKSVFTFGTLLVGGALVWFVTAVNSGLGTTLSLGGMVIASVLDTINAFKLRPSPALTLGYTSFEGLILGAASQLFSAACDGMVPKAISATAVIVLVMLVLLRTSIVHNSPTLMCMVLIDIGFLLMFYPANLMVSLIFPAANSHNATLFGFPLWVVVPLVTVALVTLSLVTNFDYIFQAVENGALVEAVWTCVFGPMVALVWLYVELLRVSVYIASTASDN